MEVWKTAKYMCYDGTIRVFHRYEVNNVGVVRNKLTGKIIKQNNSPKLAGNALYKRVKMNLVYDDYKRRLYCFVHRLVLSTFKPLPTPVAEMHTDHIDFDIENNDINNLRWLSGFENRARRQVTYDSND